MKKRIDRSASGLEYSTSARSSARYFPSRHVSTPSTAQHSLPSTMNGSYPTTCSHHFFPCRSTSHATYPILQWSFNNIQISEHLPLPSFLKISSSHGHTTLPCQPTATNSFSIPSRLARLLKSYIHPTRFLPVISNLDPIVLQTRTPNL